MRRLLPALALSLAACAYSTSNQRAAGAPVLSPSPYAEVLKADPGDKGQLIGTVSARGNNWQSPAGCEAQLVNEARKLGANAVLTTPADATLGRGPKCEGKAYLVRP